MIGHSKTPLTKPSPPPHSEIEIYELLESLPFTYSEGQLSDRDFVRDLLIYDGWLIQYYQKSLSDKDMKKLLHGIHIDKCIYGRLIECRHYNVNKDKLFIIIEFYLCVFLRNSRDEVIGDIMLEYLVDIIVDPNQARLLLVSRSASMFFKPITTIYLYFKEKVFSLIIDKG